MKEALVLKGYYARDVFLKREALRLVACGNNEVELHLMLLIPIITFSVDDMVRAHRFDVPALVWRV